MSTLRTEYLDAIGIQSWRRREIEAHVADPPAPVAEPATLVAKPTALVDYSALDWGSLRTAVAACTACGLHASRQQTVFGAGSHDAELLIIGEAPGADEDRVGEPFVGRAGQLLNAMLAAIGLRREQVFIANILKCRPPNNRDPKPAESSQCAPFLTRQIELLQPRVCVALGRISAQWLLQSELPVGKLRGQITPLEPWGIPLVVSYHPAYLLRSPSAKAKAWQDLLVIKSLLSKDK